jgi:hypothetical protein
MKISYQAFSTMDTTITLLGYLSTAILFWFYLQAQKPAYPKNLLINCMLTGEDKATGGTRD